MIGRRCSASGAVALLDRNEIALEVAREGEGIAVRFCRYDGALGASHQLVSSWKPGDRCGRALSMATRSPCRCGRCPMASASHQGFEVAVNVLRKAKLLPRG